MNATTARKVTATAPDGSIHTRGSKTKHYTHARFITWADGSLIVTFHTSYDNAATKFEVRGWRDLPRAIVEVSEV